VSKVHYPLYWHFDILTGLKAMARVNSQVELEAGRL
jgi:hypothetical protein